MNNTQKRTLRRIIIETALLLLLLPLQARAAEYKCTAELPVEVRTSGAATAERFTITLTPEDGAPAPAADTVQVKGSGTAGFTGLTYTAPGDYRYTVRQCAGGTAHMTYDATVYTVTVRVTNRPNAQVRPAQVRPAPNRRPHAGDPAGRAGRALCRWANGSIL